MRMNAMKGRRELFSLGMLLLGSLVMVDTVCSQDEVSFFTRQDFGVGGNSSSITTGDFNGDGLPDLATANFAGTVSILLGQGDGTFAAGPEVEVAPLAVAITVGDFNGDGDLDLAVAHGSGEDMPVNSVSILLGQGDGTFAAGPEVGVGAGPTDITVGDFNGDGHPDVATANVNGPSVSILLGLGDGTFARAADVEVGVNPFSLTMGDFNSDGHLDLATVNPNSSSVSILLGQGDGTFQVAHVGVDENPTAIAVGDFNGDGHLDLATPIDGNVSILLGQGDGTFQVAHVVGTGSAGPTDITVGDFNGDGDPDLAVGNYFPSSTVGIWLGQGDGTFAAGPEVGGDGESRAVRLSIGDFNGDGHPDLAVTGLAANSVSILLNNTSVEIAVQTDIKPDSFPNRIDPKSNMVIPVAILTTDTFDAMTVDPLSVRFGPKSAMEAHNTGHIEDVNHDGKSDLLLHFNTQATGIKCGDISASLTGATVDGALIQSADAIKTVGCKKTGD